MCLNCLDDLTFVSGRGKVDMRLFLQLRRAGSRLFEGGYIIPMRKEEANAFIIVY
jgi:hypothetical protein